MFKKLSFGKEKTIKSVNNVPYIKIHSAYIIYITKQMSNVYLPICFLFYNKPSAKSSTI